MANDILKALYAFRNNWIVSKEKLRCSINQSFVSLYVICLLGVPFIVYKTKHATTGRRIFELDME